MVTDSYIIITYDGNPFSRYNGDIVTYKDLGTAARDFEGDDITIILVSHDNLSAKVTDKMSDVMLGEFPIDNGKVQDGVKNFIKNYDFFANYTKKRNCGTIFVRETAKQTT